MKEVVRYTLYVEIGEANVPDSFYSLGTLERRRKTYNVKHITQLICTNTSPNGWSLSIKIPLTPAASPAITSRSRSQIK